MFFQSMNGPLHPAAQRSRSVSNTIAAERSGLSGTTMPLYAMFPFGFGASSVMDMKGP
jgi:hypothetical protein